jgi:hypothetical protein
MERDVIILGSWWTANESWLRARLNEEYYSLDDAAPEKVKIIRIKGKKGTYICSGKPLYRSRNLLGRTTRCFIGIKRPTSEDVNNLEAMLVKDHWRVIAEGLRPEGETYTKLRNISDMAPYLAKLDESGDLLEHK